MKKVIYGFLGVVAVLCVALAIIPPFINWDNYKPLAQEYARKALNRDLVIEGPIRIEVFPAPHVALKQVRLSNPQGFSTPDMIKVEEIDVYASLFSLLRGHVVLSKVHLVKPDISLEDKGNGQNNWTFDTKALASQEITPSEPSAQKTSANVQLHSLTLKKGHLSYKSGETTYALSDIKATLEGDSEKGPAHLKADFSCQNQPVSAHITLKNLANMQAIPLESFITADAHSLKTTGEYNWDKQAFAGDIILHVDSKILPAASHKFFKQPLTLTGHLVFDVDHLLLNPLHLTSGNVDAMGYAKVGFNTQTPHEITIEKLPGRTSLSLKGMVNDKPEKEWQGKAVFSSANAIALFDWLHLPRVPSLTENMKGLKLQFNYSFSPTHIGISNLDARTGDTQLSGAVAWANQQLKVDLKTPSLTPLLGLAGYPATFKGGAAAINGIFQGDLQQLRFDTSLQVIGGSFQCKGQLSDILANLHYTVSLSGAHPNTNTLLAGFGHELKGFRLGATKVQIQFSGNPNEMTIQTLNGSLQPRQKAFSFRGKGALDFKANRPRITGNIQFTDFNLNDFLPSTQLSATNPGQLKLVLVAHRKNTPVHHTTTWSQEPIDFSALQSFEGSLNLKALSFTASRYTVKNLNAELKNSANGLTIAPFKADIFKGNLSGSLHVTAEATPSLRLVLSCRNGSLDHFLASSPQEKTLSGIFDLNVDLASRGANPRAIISQLNGKIDLDVNDGIIYGFDLDAISQNIQKLSDVTGFLNLLQIFMNKGQTRFSSFKSLFDVQQGIARSKSIKLLANAGTGQGQGYADLVRWWMEGDATFKLAKPESLPAFAMHMEGPLDNPQKSLNTQQLQNYLFETFASKAVGKLVPKKFRDLLPFLPSEGQEKPSPNQKSDQNNQKPLPAPRPEKELKKAIENLLGF